MLDKKGKKPQAKGKKYLALGSWYFFSLYLDP
jgi:hypothetical protein